MYLLYGIKNCDKVRAAKKWLESKNIQFQFQDIRDNPVSNSNWESWIAYFGMDKLINRRSTTWKQLPESTKQKLSDLTAINLLNEFPTLMKRPLLTENNKALLIGFSERQYSDHFKG